MRKRKSSIFVKRQFRYLAHIFCEKLNRTPLLIRGRRQFWYLVALTNHDDPSPFVLPQRQCRYCPAMAEGGGDASFRRIAALSRNSNPYNNWERAEFDVGPRNSPSLGGEGVHFRNCARV